MKPRKAKRHYFKYTIGTILLILAIVIFIATNWATEQFQTLDFNTILFHLKVPLAGTNTAPFQGIIIKCIIIAPIAALVGLFAAIKCSDSRLLVIQVYKLKLKIPLNFWQRFYVLCSALVLLFSVILNARYLGLDTYLANQMSSSGFFEENYVAPEEVALTFPEEKRNLIYIFLESMENTYASAEYGGNEYANFIPEMVDLQLANTNFTASNQYLNGAYAATGSTWTIGAMVAQTAGVPLLIPIDDNSMNEYATFLPGAYSIGDILESEGYTQEFLLGSDVTFGGRSLYMTQHGNYRLLDYYYALSNEWIPSDYYVFWGYEDQILYENAKEELTILSQSDQPFNLTMLTVDTHFTDGYFCDLCEDTYQGQQYTNVISCASRQLYNFIAWVQEQNFYENTTIVIAGDHLTMDNAYIENTLINPSEYQRTVYTTIINPATSYTLDYDRVFTTFDLYPTTLAAMGVQIEGDRMGLGTNLFSETPTLVEQLGLDVLNEALSKTSPFYNANLLYQ